MTFGTTRVVGRKPHVLAAFTTGEIPGTHFQVLSRTQGTWFRKKKSPVTPPGIDPETVGLVVQCLNHYATPGPIHTGGFKKMWQASWYEDMTQMSFSNSHEYYFCPYCLVDFGCFSVLEEPDIDIDHEDSISLCNFTNFSKIKASYPIRSWHVLRNHHNQVGFWTWGTHGWICNYWDEWVEWKIKMLMDDEPEGIGKEDLPWTSSIFFPDILLYSLRRGF